MPWASWARIPMRVSVNGGRHLAVPLLPFRMRFSSANNGTTVVVLTGWTRWLAFLFARVVVWAIALLALVFDWKVDVEIGQSEAVP
jgi:hypothetical protein